MCPRELPVRQKVIEARSRFSPLYGRHGLQKTLARLALSRSGLLKGLLKAGAVLEHLPLIPEDSGLRIRLGLIEKGAEPGSADRNRPGSGQQPGQPGLSYFIGCHARYLQPSVADATRKLVGNLASAPLYEPEDQACCGLAAWSAGKKGEAKRLAQRNIEAFAGSDEPILASCASCSNHLATYPELFANDPVWRKKAEKFSARIREFSSFLAPRSAGVTFRAGQRQTVHHHEPCHLRFDGEKKHGVDAILARIGNITVAAPDDGPQCCGQGGLFHLDYPELSARIFAGAVESFQPLDAGIVVTTCSGCLMQWQSGLAVRHSPVRAVHLAVFLADCLDIDA